jgi:hypothetical protein
MGDDEHDKSIIEKTMETVKDIATKRLTRRRRHWSPNPQSPARRLSSCLRRVMVLPIP